MPKKYSFGFICDSLDNFNRESETTLFWMKELGQLGHPIFVCEPKDLYLKQKEVYGRVKQITMTAQPRCFYRILREVDKKLATLDCLFLRKDPPFDLAYLAHLLLLMKLEGRILMINEPSALLKYNEKLVALDFSFAPKTYVGTDIDGILNWAKDLPQGVVVKPLGEAGGRGVKWIKKSQLPTSNVQTNPKSQRILKQLTSNETIPILCQEYLPAIRQGDKRILLWNGKCIGAFVRRPTKKGEFRANLHLGGRFEACDLSASDRKIIRTLGPWTKREGLYFTGIDVIGSKLTEINVTSPMGIREVNQLYGKQIEKEMIRDILKRL